MVTLAGNCHACIGVVVILVCGSGGGVCVGGAGIAYHRRAVRNGIEVGFGRGRMILVVVVCEGGHIIGGRSVTRWRLGLASDSDVERPNNYCVVVKI